MKLLKKLSVATAAATKDFLKSVKGETPILRVVGIARGVEDIQTQYGIAKKFKGEFRGTDLQSGEVSASPVLYLPNPIDLLLAEGVAASEGKPVEFGFDIFVKPSDREGGAGYEYVSKTLLEAKPSDPLAALLSHVGEAPKPAALAGPAGEGHKEAEVAPKEGKKE